MPYRILFICMGNICRSPAGEGVMAHLIETSELAGKVLCDSAGTIGFHAGEPADARMQCSAVNRGIELTSRSRQVKAEDLETFDLILAMDQDNYAYLQQLDHQGKYGDKIKLFCDYCREHTEQEVPDPYYGGDQGFEHVLDLLLDGCSTIKQDLLEQLSD